MPCAFGGGLHGRPHALLPIGIRARLHCGNGSGNGSGECGRLAMAVLCRVLAEGRGAWSCNGARTPNGSCCSCCSFCSCSSSFSSPCGTLDANAAEAAAGASGAAISPRQQLGSPCRFFIFFCFFFTYFAYGSSFLLAPLLLLLVGTWFASLLLLLLMLLPGRGERGDGGRGQLKTVTLHRHTADPRDEPWMAAELALALSLISLWPLLPDI